MSGGFSTFTSSNTPPTALIFVILHFHSFYFQGFFLLFLFVRLLFPKKIIKLIKVKRKEKVNKKENENK
jgi:hypothetical protein